MNSQRQFTKCIYQRIDLFIICNRILQAKFSYFHFFRKKIKKKRKNDNKDKKIKKIIKKEIMKKLRNSNYIERTYFAEN